ncbi:MAG: PadR family transcriptional regulator [Lysobacterales bacterium]
MRTPQFLSAIPRSSPRSGASRIEAAGRMREIGGGGGAYPGQDGPGDNDHDDAHGWTRGRKFSADDLQLMLLGLLEENPSHGYELIKALGALGKGFYTPSPGMVYPALTYPEELGYATMQADRSKKRYHLAPAGADHLSANRERLCC